MQNHDIVAIGGSSGAVDVLRRIVGDLPPDLAATIFIVTHVGASPSILPSILNDCGPLPAKFGADGEAFDRGRIYVAPPDRHLLVDGGRMVVRRGPRENLARPAIDPLFRSVAASFGPRAIGIVLTGALSDGSAGLVAIKRCRGITVVQDPADADYPSMPNAAIDAVEIDHVVAAGLIARLIARLVAQEAEAPMRTPDDIRREVEIAANGASVEPVTIPPDAESAPVFGCPDCGGPLSIVGDSVLRLRCAVGHAHTAASLLEAQGAQIEKALWVAHRTNRERAVVLRRMAAEARERHQERSAVLWDDKALEFEAHAKLLQDLLQDDVFTHPRVGAETR